MNNIVKVDMIPKSFGVRTLSCSQGDTKREFKFTLNDVNGTIDTSDVEIALPQFPVYKGGTEEILPTNGSTPTTSPIIADIRYPDALRTDQTFFYRESPTQESGNARLRRIKGNTLVWNQLVQNGNFADTSKWIKGNGASSLAISNNEAVITIGGAWNNDVRQNQGASFISGHKYFASFEAKATIPITVALRSFNTNPIITFAALRDLQTTFKKIASIVTAQTNANDFRIELTDNGSSYVGETFTVRNVQIIDLTAMGLDITDPSEFTSLFPLPFYNFNQGTLIPFSGNGIKTTGKNLFPYPYSETTKTQNGLTFTDNGDGTITVNGTATAQTYFNLFINTSEARPKMIGGTYVFSNANSLPMGTQVTLTARKSDGTAISSFSLTNSRKEHSLTIGENFEYNSNISISSGTTLNNYVFALMFEFGSTATSYEPYTSTTTDLPISTYFPTGMKRAGNVYDELTESKAITRVGAVDLGTLNWTYDSTVPRFYSIDINSLVKSPLNSANKANAVSSMYENTSFDKLYASEKKNMTMAFGTTGTFSIINTSYTSASAFKTAMSGVYLYYELATETETEITSASLVTENGEIQLLPQGDYLVGTVNSSVSRKSGMFDAKVKLANGDGTVYSNKLQLYVERSPK